MSEINVKTLNDILILELNLRTFRKNGICTVEKTLFLVRRGFPERLSEKQPQVNNSPLIHLHFDFDQRNYC